MAITVCQLQNVTAAPDCRSFMAPTLHHAKTMRSRCCRRYRPGGLRAEGWLTDGGPYGAADGGRGGRCGYRRGDAEAAEAEARLVGVGGRLCGGRGHAVLLLPVAFRDASGHVRWGGERAAGVGHAARRPAAARLDGRGCVLLHHRTARVHGRGVDPRAWT